MKPQPLGIPLAPERLQGAASPPIEDADCASLRGRQEFQPIVVKLNKQAKR